MMDARGEGGDNHNQRHAHAHPCERLRADPFDVADIHTVHHIIEYVYDLRGYRGHRKPEQELADAALPKVGLDPVFHVLSPQSFSNF